MIDFLEPRNCPRCGYFTYAEEDEEDENSVSYFCEECGEVETIEEDE